MAVWIEVHTKEECLAIEDAISPGPAPLQMYVDGQPVDQRIGVTPDHIFGNAWKVTGYTLGCYRVRGRQDDPELGFLIRAHFVRSVWEE